MMYFGSSIDRKSESKRFSHTLSMALGFYGEPSVSASQTERRGHKKNNVDNTKNPLLKQTKTTIKFTEMKRELRKVNDDECEASKRKASESNWDTERVSECVYGMPHERDTAKIRWMTLNILFLMIIIEQLWKMVCWRESTKCAASKWIMASEPSVDLLLLSHFWDTTFRFFFNTGCCSQSLASPLHLSVQCVVTFSLNPEDKCPQIFLIFITNKQS